VRLFRLSADKGNSFAQNNLGFMYSKGYGVHLNHNEAVKWFSASAEQDNPNGQYNLGLAYRDGHGVKLDYKKALTYFTLSAEQCNSHGQYYLALMYLNGNGVAIDQTKALELLKLSTDNGHKLASNELRRLLREKIANDDVFFTEMCSRYFEHDYLLKEITQLKSTLSEIGK
jgi:TPR repeat protein